MPSLENRSGIPLRAARSFVMYDSCWRDALTYATGSAMSYALEKHIVGGDRVARSDSLDQRTSAETGGLTSLS
jgi:hypothetical protein